MRAPAAATEVSSAPATAQDLLAAVTELRVRLDRVEAENRELRGALRELDVARGTRSSAGAPPDGAVDTTSRGVSRRGLLAGAGGAAAVGLVALVATATPAAANSDGGSLTLGDGSNTAAHPTAVSASLTDFPTFAATNTAGGGTGVLGRGHGTSGISTFGAGVRGDSDSYPGVYGTAATGYGVVGVTGGLSGLAFGTAGVAGDSAKQPGVAGSSQDAPGVTGQSTTSNGVYGTSNTATAVYGRIASSGFTAVAGTVGEAASTYGAAGFSASKAGVRAASGTGEGIKATSTSGVGGSFSGARAAINLVPSSASGRPTTGAHSRGDIVVGSTGTMFLCTVSGTPGTWVRFTVTAAP
jgi:hypothetical protein